MRACDADALALERDFAQQGCTLYDFETVLTEVGQNTIVVGNGRGVDHQCLRRIAKRLGNECFVVIIDDACPLIDKSASEVGRSAVVACYAIVVGKEVSDQIGHSYAAGSDEIYVSILHSLN